MVHTTGLATEAEAALREVKEGFVSSAVGDGLADAGFKKPRNVQVLNWKNIINGRGELVGAFSLNPLNMVNSGGSVTYVNMQIAWWKGYRRLLCVGLDHNFTGSRGDHFTSDYNKDVGIPYEGNPVGGVGAGKWFWHGETFYKKTAIFYRIALGQFQGEIYNLTPGSKLDEFPMGSIDEW